MVFNIFFLVLGMVLLIKGADWLVNGASALAKKYKVSDLTIGLTVVAFGTSAPELVVNVVASSQGLNDIVYGNVIGSNIANLFLILGITGIIFPLMVQSTTIWRQIPYSFFAVLLLYFLSNNFFLTENPLLSRIDGLVLLLMFILFIVYVYRQLKKDSTPNEITILPMSLFKTWLFIF
mgnify:CR=1 FL=1